MIDGLVVAVLGPQRLAIEPLFKDRFERRIIARADLECAQRCRLEPSGTKALFKAQDPHARPEALFGMRAILKDLFAQELRAVPDPSRLSEDLLERPVSKTAVRRRHVFGQRGMPPIAAAAHVNRDPLSTHEDLERARRQAGFNWLASFTTSLPSFASPTISKLASFCSKLDTPVRNIWWSSAKSIRVLFIAAA